MDLQLLNIPGKKIKQLNKAGIETLEDLLLFFPRKHRSREKLTGILPGPEESVTLFKPVSRKFLNRKIPIVKLTGYECGTNIPVHIMWFHQAYLYNKLESVMEKEILVAGTAVYKEAGYGEPERYEITAPSIFDENGIDALGIYPVYRNISGMAEDYLKTCICKAATLLGKPQETVADSILQKHGLVSHAEMIYQMHWATTQDNLAKAYERMLWDDLLYFALRIELNFRNTAMGSPFNLPLLRLTNTVKNGLPFELTEDQRTVLDEMLQQIRNGKRLNALIQGDVGCGKTIVAFLLMTAFAENGCQAALMAPTQLLAKQHYEDLTKLLAPYNINVAFVSGQKLKKAEQTKLEAGIASGECQLIVGTQALLSKNYKFHKLALVVEDEEHKYGVMQRQTLTEKAALGTHIVTMSATPIPRTLAQTIYGDHIQHYSIRSKPAGRNPVTTGIAENMDRVFQFVYGQVKKKGHQIYVVCPMIAPNEKVEGVATAEETFEAYQNALAPYGISVGIVTGKTKKTEAAQILQDFAENKISVLVSTTVIEVGINVPNATGIIIHNAERFGLAQLHQLRGRVGRGSAQGVCVLVSEDRENKRLAALCSSNDGFRIAELDLEQRGAGDFLGNRQSGTERYLAMALKYPKEYAKAQEDAKWLLDTGMDCELLKQAVQDHADNIGGEMLS